MNLRENNIIATLVFLTKIEDGCKKVLLVEKVGKIGAGCYNGFGGTKNKKETPRACAIRELRQESGLFAFKEDLKFAGVMTAHNQRENGTEFKVKFFIFTLDKWRGNLKLKENEVKNPKWFRSYRPPLKRMMPGDEKFVPAILAGKHNGCRLRGEVWYGPNQEYVIDINIKWIRDIGDID